MEYLFTERAHLMCPNMCFGIVMRVSSAFDEKRIRSSVSALARVHSFLRAFIGHEEENNAYYYKITTSSQISVSIKKDEIKGILSSEIMEEYEKFTANDIDLSTEGMLFVTAWKSGEFTCFLMIFHHLLADGRGALALANELASHYAKGTAPRFVQEKLISSQDELPKKSKLPFVSKAIITRANNEWERDNSTPLSYSDYHRFADSFLKTDSIAHTVTAMDSHETAKLADNCREHSVTVNDFLMARMYIKEKTDKIVIASDLRDQLSCYAKGALGNYSTAVSIIVKKRTENELALAQEVHKRVQKAISDPAQLYLVLQCYANLSPALLDAAFTASKGGFQSKPAAFIGSSLFGFGKPEGFCITNLGKTDNKVIDSAYFIPPASPAMRKTLGVVTVNGKMTLCTSERP